VPGPTTEASLNSEIRAGSTNQPMQLLTAGKRTVLNLPNIRSTITGDRDLGRGAGGAGCTNGLGIPRPHKLPHEGNWPIAVADDHHYWQRRDGTPRRRRRCSGKRRQKQSGQASRKGDRSHLPAPILSESCKHLQYRTCFGMCQYLDGSTTSRAQAEGRQGTVIGDNTSPCWQESYPAKARNSGTYRGGRGSPAPVAAYPALTPCPSSLDPLETRYESLRGSAQGRHSALSAAQAARYVLRTAPLRTKPELPERPWL
jgi:hypothetical protein